MNDLIFSVVNLSYARLNANEAIELLDGRGFRLVKWNDNKEVVPVLSEFDKDVLAAGIHELYLSLDTNENLPDTKALGCVWETGEDRFRIVSLLKPLDNFTGRSMLSHMSKSFNSLGIFSQFFVKARLILQKLAIDKRDWDDEVSESVVKEWKMWFKVLDSLLDILLARHYFAGSIPVSPKDNEIY